MRNCSSSLTVAQIKAAFEAKTQTFTNQETVTFQGSTSVLELAQQFGTVITGSKKNIGSLQPQPPQQQQHQHQQQHQQQPHQQQQQQQQQPQPQQQQQPQPQQQQQQQHQHQQQQQQLEQPQQPTIADPKNSSLNKNFGLFNSQTNKYEFTTLGPNPRAFSFDRLEFLRLLRANQLAFSGKGEYYFGLQALNDRTSSQVNLKILPFLHAKTDKSSTDETIINIPTSNGEKESINLKDLQGLIDAEEMRIREEQVRKNMLREVRYGGRFAPRVYIGNQTGAINYPALPFNHYSTFGPYLQPPTPPLTSQNQYMTPTKIPTIRVVDHQNHNNAYAMNDSNRPLSLRYLIQQQPYHR